MTAGVIARASQSSPGLRPIDPRRDMGQVADLIEATFRGDLDGTARRMVREMRTLGRIGWVGWALSRLLLPPAARPFGFVWEENERIVGNASLLPVSGHPRRWVMANVAVHPEYRRRGIARQMVDASDHFARKAGASLDSFGCMSRFEMRSSSRNGCICQVVIRVSPLKTGQYDAWFAVWNQCVLFRHISTVSPFA